MVNRKKTQETAFYIRNFIFGVKDSLVSTVGLLSGVAVGGIAIIIGVLVGRMIGG